MRSPVSSIAGDTNLSKNCLAISMLFSRTVDVISSLWGIGRILFFHITGLELNDMNITWVKQIKEVHTILETNRLLEDGWKLLLICGSVTFVLGHE
jgi:hypothetical protein